MAKNKDIEITDKLFSIKKYMENLLRSKGIIDVYGNILSLDRFRAEVYVATTDTEVKMLQYTTVDGVVTNREMYSILAAEKKYLEDLAKHTTNFYPQKQNPIISHQDLQKPRKKPIGFKLKLTCMLIQDRIASRLQH